jgi:hypothetical protein
MKVSVTSSIGAGFSITPLPVPSNQQVTYAALAASYIKHHLSQATNLTYRKVIKSSCFTVKRLLFHLILCPCPRMPSTSDSPIQESCFQTRILLCKKCTKYIVSAPSAPAPAPLAPPPLAPPRHSFTSILKRFRYLVQGREETFLLYTYTYTG